MKTIGIAAVAVVAALILGFGARLSTPTAHAATTGSVVIGCEFLIGAIDGDSTDVSTPLGVDGLAACDGLSVADLVLLAGGTTAAPHGLGDNDGVLEISDFATIDLDGNQIRNTTTPSNAPYNSTYFIEFVDDEGPVQFDAPTGLTVNNGALSGGANVSVPFSGGEFCNTDADDADCGVAGAVGDGIVVALITDGTTSAGDAPTVDAIQESVSDPQTLLVTGSPHDVTLTLAETTIEATGSATAFAACLKANDVADSTTLSQPTTTLAIAVVTDADGTKLTRVPVTLKSGSTDVADIGTGDPSSNTLSNTVETVDAGTNGTALFAVICGGKTTGIAKITATINPGNALSEDTSSADLTVVGPASAVALTASPAQISCDGTQTSSVTAKVTDSAGNNVADGTTVNFSVVALGTANPINVKTTAGSASSTITPLSAGSAGVTVTVSSGDASASIRVDCSLPVPTAVPPGFVASPTPPVGTIPIRVSDTGSGGYLNQDGSSSFPMWTLVALALGSVVLVAGGMVTRRAGK